MYNKIISIGIGDSTNDLEMFSKVDHACVVKSKNKANLMKEIDSNKIIYSILNEEMKHSIHSLQILIC